MSLSGTTLFVFLAYVIAVAGLDWLAYRKFHQPWIRRERARNSRWALVVLPFALPWSGSGR